jgi:hypothetical protein
VPRPLDVPVSERVGIARLANDAIDLTDGVTPTSGPAGRWQTNGGRDSIPGVLAVEDSRGRVDVELHLVVRWPPVAALEQIADELRSQLRRAAGAAGMGDRLGAVSVTFDDVLVQMEAPS